MNYSQIITALSDLIVNEMARQCQEEHFPSHSPDTMDDKIAYHRGRVRTLINVRTELEFVAAGYVGSPVAVNGCGSMVDLLKDIKK